MPSLTTKPWNGKFCLICGFYEVSDAEGEHCENCLNTILYWLNLVFGLDIRTMTRKFPDGHEELVSMRQAEEVNRRFRERIMQFGWP